MLKKKRFVRAAAGLLLLIIALALASCDPGSINLRKEDLKEGAVCAELIEYENPSQKSFVAWVFHGENDLAPFDNERATVTKTLEDERLDGFLDRLSQLVILESYYSFDSPKGTCVRLTYEDGSFLIISGGYIGRFEKNGKVKKYVGVIDSSSAFSDLLKELSAE